MDNTNKITKTDAITNVNTNAETWSNTHNITKDKAIDQTKIITSANTNGET